MNSDDPTKELRDVDGKATQPMIADLFRLVEAMKQSMETRFDEMNVRLDEINGRLDQTNGRLDQTNGRLDQTNARLDATDARFDAIESRFARDLAAVEARLSDKMEIGFLQMGDKIDALNRSRLQMEADQSNILRRVRDLESKAS